MMFSQQCQMQITTFFFQIYSYDFRLLNFGAAGLSTSICQTQMWCFHFSQFKSHPCQNNRLHLKIKIMHIKLCLKNPVFGLISLQLFCQFFPLYWPMDTTKRAEGTGRVTTPKCNQKYIWRVRPLPRSVSFLTT